MKNLTYLKTSKTIFLKIFRMSIKQVYIAPGIYWGVIIKEWGGVLQGKYAGILLVRCGLR